MSVTDLRRPRVDSTIWRQGRFSWRANAPRAVAAAIWLNLVTLVAVALLLRLAGDRWWPATLLLFGPRWWLGLPMLGLLPLGAGYCRRRLWVVAISAAIFWLAILGFRIPWGRAYMPAGQPLRVLSYNVAGNLVSAEAMQALVDHVRPDVVALQECGADAYRDVFTGWNVCQQGELLLAARFPLEDRPVISSRHPPHRWPRATVLDCTVHGPAGDIQVATVHLPSPRYGLSALVDRQTLINPSRRELLVQETANRDRVSRTAAAALAERGTDRVVLGDFNMPIDSALYRRDWSGYRNAFSSRGFGLGHSVRAEIGGFHTGARIDHVLTHGAWRPVRCWLGPDLGSDHLPVIAEIVRQ